MAKFEIVGVECSKGKYQGYDFHNLNLKVHWLEGHERRDFKGVVTDSIKIKFKEVRDILGDVMDFTNKSDSDIESLTASSFEFLIGEHIQAYYNRYGGIEGLRFLSENTKS